MDQEYTSAKNFIKEYPNFKIKEWFISCMLILFL